ncbi:MAG: hypothetical protein B6I31_03115 [Desulfobacteraceae bacterium 4572_19]|nr:MAG: hypothetical protein B6I31_03115 [Desulfobacteraceae bacterium 4572_19]
MPKITKKDLKTLIKLQDIQTEIQRLTRILNSVDGKKAKLDLELKKFKVLLATNENVYNTLNTRKKELEDEHRASESRIEKSRETLKIITTNKEYQVLLREIDDNTKKRSTMEDELLFLMEEVEKAEKAIKERQTEFLLLSKRISSEKELLESSCINDKEELSDFKEQLEIVGKNLDSKLMNRFKGIAASSNGIAVVKVVDSVCTGCHLNVPPQLNIEIKRGESLIFCHQCHRILYWSE